MLIYRIEDAFGGGMYRPSELSSCDCPFEEIVDEFPDKDMCSITLLHGSEVCVYDYSSIHVYPIDDFPRKVWGNISSNVQQKYSFAFPTITSLLSWVYMKEWREELHRRGFKVSVYDAKAIVSDSGAQAIFKKKHSKKVGEISLLEVEAEARDVDTLNELLRQAYEELDHIKQVEFPRRVELVTKGWREKVSRLETELEELKKLNREGDTKVSGGVEPAFEFKYTRNILEQELGKYHED